MAQAVSEAGAPGRVGGTRRIRRYALAGAVAAGLILIASTGMSFLATNGTASATVSTSGSGSGDVYTPNCSASPCTDPTLPSGITTLDWGAASSATPQEPAWSAAQGQVTAVSTPGDVALVSGTAGPTLITVALINAAAMPGAYTYVNIPLEIYKCTVSSGTCAMAADTTNHPEEYLSFSNASLTFQVTGGTGVYYEVVVPTGGSMYVYSTTTTADLAANFLVTGQIL